jgi:hypothetical protein
VFEAVIDNVKMGVEECAAVSLVFVVLEVFGGEGF